MVTPEPSQHTGAAPARAAQALPVGPAPEVKVGRRPPPFFGRSAGFAPLPRDALSQYGSEQQPAPPLQPSRPAVFADPPSLRGLAENSVKVASPKTVGISCPCGEHHGSTSHPRNGHRDTAETSPFPSSTSSLGGRREVPELSFRVTNAPGALYKLTFCEHRKPRSCKGARK